MKNSNETQNKQVVTTQEKGETNMAVPVKVQENKKLNLKTQKNILELFRYIYEEKHTYYSLIPEFSGNWRIYFNEKFNMTLGAQKTNMLVDDVNAYLRNFPNKNLNEYLEEYGTKVINVVKNKIEVELRQIHRMITALNSFCPCIKTSTITGTSRELLSIEFDFTEAQFDENFGDANNAPLLYVFLKSYYIRKLSLNELMATVVVLKKRNTCKNPAKLNKAKKLAACDIIREILKTTCLIEVNKENGICQIGNIYFLNF